MNACQHPDCTQAADWKIYEQWDLPTGRRDVHSLACGDHVDPVIRASWPDGPELYVVRKINNEGATS